MKQGNSPKQIDSSPSRRIGRLGWMRVSVSCVLLAATALAQPAAKPAPKLAGFPFQDETLRYHVLLPSGLPLGDVTFSAHHTESGWAFDTSIDATVMGFTVADKYHSTVTGQPDLCSLNFDRATTHGKKKTREKITFDQSKRTVHRETVLPQDGGKTDYDVSSCARDALGFLYFVRQEMGQGRVAPQQQVYYGAPYSVQLRYTGEMTIRVEDKPQVTDHVVASIKGPKADVSAEIFFARDAARTPLLVKIPLSTAAISLELVR